MSVTAKFKVSRVTEQSSLGGRNGEIVPSAEIELTPDYAGERNKDWSYYTPSGVMRMNVNGPALEIMKLGQAFTVTFEPED